MNIAQLYTYPIKSLRGISTPEATLTPSGFQYDRRFMLLRVKADGSLENMHVSRFPQMTLFHTAITPPSPLAESERGSNGAITVTFRPPDGDPASVDVPLHPATDDAPLLDVVMHQSPTSAFDMGPALNGWFSRCFGFDVVLAYLGHHRRPVLMSRPQSTSSSWLSSLASSVPSLLGGNSGADTAAKDDGITFADCAPVLVVSATSLADVSARLPSAERPMDVTKFRPNIVVSGAGAAWEEDLWGEIATGSGVRFSLPHNCFRCASVNVDYATGKPGAGESGQVLKKLQKDRRIDSGAKWSPVFGRYGFPGPADAGKTLRVGDEVRVVKRNADVTKFDWPGLSSF
ncbi:uncharacterized protein K452DRAFT_282176 [Aplosporella prunicola CBS 121167]|uniref:MOSC domain-containing protein n=1 Tax=Aplosporella prunicola CBS 121167 TaxID=1176127 RepID=A0A6A6BSX9_9PEZI|nr:uncharacterized protein K452DRAFT_282176 [Aplosporella prunicola CBS 121167]KAF2147196.1 hypothetical protein K452DRAFT_282176 [Aplosporella prunicola CBS 121167]